VLNKIMVIGNVGTDPDMRYTPNGTPVTSFRIATNRRYNTQDGERREETEWFRVVAWNRLAEQCNQYVTKGMRVYAEGRLKSDTWTGMDGQTRFTNEINANIVLFLDRAPQGGGGGYEGGDSFSPGAPPASDEDDLPW
jgi:single-strand DNA-binding protein